MKNLVKIAKQNIPLIVPKHLGKLIAKEPEFYPLFNYIHNVKPIIGEIGIYNSTRIIVNQKVTPHTGKKGRV